MKNRNKPVRLTDGQSEVLGVLRKYGPLPDHALVPLAQHVVHTHQSSSSIRSRRAELARKGFVVDSGDVALTASGRKAVVWEAV